MEAVPARSGLILMPTCWAEQAASHHAAAADLTEELAHRLWLDDRTAYVIIGQAVSAGVWSRPRKTAAARFSTRPELSGNGIGGQAGNDEPAGQGQGQGPGHPATLSHRANLAR